MPSPFTARAVVDFEYQNISAGITQIAASSSSVIYRYGTKAFGKTPFNQLVDKESLARTTGIILPILTLTFFLITSTLFTTRANMGKSFVVKVTNFMQNLGTQSWSVINIPV